jgi:hypothetical protein
MKNNDVKKGWLPAVKRYLCVAGSELVIIGALLMPGAASAGNTVPVDVGADMSLQQGMEKGVVVQVALADNSANAGVAGQSLPVVLALTVPEWSRAGRTDVRTLDGADSGAPNTVDGGEPGLPFALVLVLAALISLVPVSRRQ